MMSRKILAQSTVLSLALALAACGGDDSSTSLSGVTDGSTGGGGGTTDAPAESAAGDLQVFSSAAQLNTGSGSNATITAVIKSPTGVVLEGETVAFGVNNNGSLIIENAETNASGIATATVSGSLDPRNRTLTVTATSGDQTDSVNVDLVGTSLALTGPSSIPSGQTATYQVALTDGSGAAIGGESVRISSDRNSPTVSSVTTSASGIASFDIVGSVSGLDTVTVEAFSGDAQIFATKSVSVSPDSFSFDTPSANTEIDLNTPETITVEWLASSVPQSNESIQFTATRGSLTPSSGLVTTDSNGRASIQIQANTAGFSLIKAVGASSDISNQLQVEFVATTPSMVSLQAAKTQLQPNEDVQLVATVRDAVGNLVKNQTINFTLVSDASNGTLKDSTSVTDSQGRASVGYTSGAATTGSAGVQIRATVASNNSLTSDVALTVGGQPVRVALVTGNTMEEPDQTTYAYPWTVIVTDPDGAPVANAEVQLRTVATRYKKGSRTYVGDPGSWQIPNTAPECDAEDLDNDGVLDSSPDEDFNGNGRLDPVSSATTSASTVTTNASGQASFSQIYGQNQCRWLEVALTATVRVAGTETSDIQTYYLKCLASDMTDENTAPPGEDSPFGMGTCDQSL